jgi:hypothetical protein
MRKFLLAFFTFHFSLITIHCPAQNPCHFSHYQCDTISYNFTQITGDTLAGLAADTYSPVIPIGFTFRFYDVDYTDLIISNNGYLSFNTALADSSSPWYISVAIPSNSNPLNAVFGPWEDIYNPSGGTIHYQTIGIAPNREFIVSYDSIPMFECPNLYYSGQIILYETTNNIEIQLFNKPTCNNWNSGLAIEGVQNASGSMATAAPGRNAPSQWTAFHDGKRFIPTNGPFPAPSLCIVSVDTSTNQNLIVWNQITGIVIDSFLIYRETNIPGNYTLINTQAQTAFSTYEDVTSFPLQVSNRYKLAFMDSCGIISDTSINHKTMHLVLSAGIGTSWNLNWDAYEGFPFADYEIYRGTSPSTLALLTTVPSNVLSYNDATPPSGNIYYMIEINGNGGCNPSARTSSINYNVSMSNYASTFTIGIPAIIDENTISIFPNPANEKITVSFNIHNKTDFSVSLNDVTGRNIFTDNVLQFMGEYKAAKNISSIGLCKGVYFLQIKTEQGIYYRKVVVE